MSCRSKSCDDDCNLNPLRGAVTGQCSTPSGFVPTPGCRVPVITSFEYLAEDHICCGSATVSWAVQDLGGGTVTLNGTTVGATGTAEVSENANAVLVATNACGTDTETLVPDVWPIAECYLIEVNGPEACNPNVELTWFFSNLPTSGCGVSVWIDAVQTEAGFPYYPAAGDMRSGTLVFRPTQPLDLVFHVSDTCEADQTFEVHVNVPTEPACDWLTVTYDNVACTYTVHWDACPSYGDSLSWQVRGPGFGSHVGGEYTYETFAAAGSRVIDPCSHTDEYSASGTFQYDGILETSDCETLLDGALACAHPKVTSFEITGSFDQDESGCYIIPIGSRVALAWTGCNLKNGVEILEDGAHEGYGAAGADGIYDYTVTGPVTLTLVPRETCSTGCGNLTLCIVQPCTEFPESDPPDEWAGVTTVRVDQVAGNLFPSGCPAYTTEPTCPDCDDFTPPDPPPDPCCDSDNSWSQLLTFNGSNAYIIDPTEKAAKPMFSDGWILDAFFGYDNARWVLYLEWYIGSGVDDGTCNGDDGQRALLGELSSCPGGGAQYIIMNAVDGTSEYMGDDYWCESCWWLGLGRADPPVFSVTPV